jgi:hypothetical protein
MIGSASLSSLRSNEEITTIAKKRVIAYFMHETEKEAAVRELASAEVTDSFVVGDIEEEEIASLHSQGLIVQEPKTRPLIAEPPPDQTRSIRRNDLARICTLGEALRRGCLRPP